MSLIQSYAFHIILILVALLVVSVAINCILLRKKPKGKGRRKSSSSDSVSKSKYEETLAERNEYRNLYNQLFNKYKVLDKNHNDLLSKHAHLEDFYRQSCAEAERFKQNFEGLSRSLKSEKENSDKLLARIKSLENKTASTPKETKPVPVPPASSQQDKANQAQSNGQETEKELKEEVPITDPKKDSETNKEILEKDPSNEVAEKDSTSRATETESSMEEPVKEPTTEVVMYASFPRSAGENIYFSDLTENLVDDSFFELKLSKDKASFKPLNFMKIRNYDPAMAAMQTEGVKPNVASTVLGIEPGEAHIDGKDWVIDKTAKIKLA